MISERHDGQNWKIDSIENERSISIASMGTSSEKGPEKSMQKIEYGYTSSRQTPKTRPRASLKRLRHQVNGHTNSIRADSRRTLAIGCVRGDRGVYSGH